MDSKEFLAKQDEIIDRLKTININEVILHKLIQSLCNTYNPHDVRNLSQDYKKYYLDVLNENVNFILGLYEDLSKDMFIYMLFSKEGLLNNE